MQLVKTAGSEVSDQDVEEPHVAEGFPEPVKQCGTWFIGKKRQVVLHGSVLFVSGAWVISFNVPQSIRF